MVTKKKKKEVAVLVPERLAEIGKDFALWRVPLDCIREQDKNARVMDGDKFNRLAENIKKDGRLESLPLCQLKEKDGRKTFSIISGHHRVRASRKIELLEIIVLVIERKMTRSEVISKQLSHNSLSGYDDTQLLKELYDEIEDIDFKISSGLSEFEIVIEDNDVKIDDIKINLDYELINILFLPKQAKKLKEIFDALEDKATVYIADKKEFDRFAKTARDIAKRDNIINMSAIFARMIEIVESNLSEKRVEKVGKEKKKKKK